jgi:hypothetical protein
LKTSLEDLIPGVPEQTGNGGRLLKPTFPGTKAVVSGPMSLKEKATVNAMDTLEEEAKARAEKTARLRAARQERDSGSTR